MMIERSGKEVLGTRGTSCWRVIGLVRILYTGRKEGKLRMFRIDGYEKKEQRRTSE
jgi:hypothetical protein